jgi:hypothetical protein
MRDDPIVAEIHKIREELLKEHGGFEGHFAHIRREQEKHRDRLVSLPPRRPWRHSGPTAKTVLEDFSHLSDEEKQEVLAELLRMMRERDATK